MNPNPVTSDTQILNIYLMCVHSLIHIHTYQRVLNIMITLKECGHSRAWQENY